MIFKNAGVWVGLIFLIISLLLLHEASSFGFTSVFGPGPAVFPTMVGVVFGLFSLLYIFESMRVNAVKLRDLLPKGKNLIKFLSVFAAILLFVLIVKYTGFLIAGTLFIYILLFKEYKWYINLLVSASISGLLFLVFHIFLKVSLPTLW